MSRVREAPGACEALALPVEIVMMCHGGESRLIDKLSQSNSQRMGHGIGRRILRNE